MNYWVGGILVALVFTAMFVVGEMDRDCDGNYVRAIVGYECIEGDR